MVVGKGILREEPLSVTQRQTNWDITESARALEIQETGNCEEDEKTNSGRSPSFSCGKQNIVGQQCIRDLPKFPLYRQAYLPPEPPLFFYCSWHSSRCVFVPRASPTVIIFFRRRSCATFHEARNPISQSKRMNYIAKCKNRNWNRHVEETKINISKIQVRGLKGGVRLLGSRVQVCHIFFIFSFFHFLIFVCDSLCWQKTGNFRKICWKQKNASKRDERHGVGKDMWKKRR